MYEATRDKARTIIADQLQKIQRLRATGPNPFDYWIWADETVQALEAIYGRDAGVGRDPLRPRSHSGPARRP